MRIRLAIAVASVAILFGCKSTTPSCSDIKSVELVKQILTNSIIKSIATSSKKDSLLEQITTAMNVSVNTIRVDEHDENIAKYTCKADLEVKLTLSNKIIDEPAYKALAEKAQYVRSVESTDFTLKDTIEYTSQLTEDGKEHLVSMSGHHPTADIVSTLAISGAFRRPATFPQNLLANTDIQAAASTLLDSVYGYYDEQKKCWNNKVEEQAYCMKLSRFDVVNTKTGKRLYVMAAGEAVDANGKSNGSHTTAGVVGAFIAEEKEGLSTLVTSQSKIAVGVSGVAPDTWNLLLLGPDHWGWQSTWSDCHQGYCGSLYSIIGDHNGELKELAGFAGEYSNDGACGDDECTAKASILESKLKVNASSGSQKRYPLTITVNGISNGMPLEPNTWTLTFNEKDGNYQEPSDWPLGDVEF